MNVKMYGRTPDSGIRFGCELIIRSIHEEDSNIHVGSLIIYVCRLINQYM